MSSTRIGLAAAAVLAGSLLFGGLVVTPAAHAAIAGSQITTPSNPSFFVADEDAGTQTFGIAGTTTGGNPATNQVDVNCYWGGSFVTVAHDVPLNSDGSFSIANADLNEPLDLTCQLRAIPAGSSPSNLTPFTGPVIGVGERDSDKLAVGPNTGKITGYNFDAQQKTAAFDYVSVGGCGLNDGYLYDSTFAQTTTTFFCDAALFMADSVTTPKRAELQIDGANAYDPFSAGQINPNATGLPSLTDTYTVDKATGNVVLNETDPFVTCANATYPPNAVSCSSFVSTGVTDHRTITQDHDGHVSSIADSFSSTDSKAHSLDLLWDDSQRFSGSSGDSSQLEYEFPGHTGFSTHVAGDQVALPSAAGTIFVRMHGAADGDTGTGQGAIVYNRPASSANFNLVQSFQSEFTLRQTGRVPAGGSTTFRFAFVQDFKAANVASMAKAAAKAFLNTIAVAKSGKGKGKVTSSPGGIACGKACKHGYADGTSVTLKAKAANGSKFSGWSGACKGTRSCKVAAGGNVAVKAKFVLKPCVVPNLKGKTVKAAKLSLKKAFCSLGAVTTAGSATVTKGLVVSQKPKHGKRLKPHSKVNLVVSAG
ncbi:MAG TPA: PASTA domain-containing protein [Gaiellaceae bacterium]|nr:PASTA domain-containing protein [Gaiellaceae bacterium]